MAASEGLGLGTKAICILSVGLHIEGVLPRLCLGVALVLAI